MSNIIVGVYCIKNKVNGKKYIGSSNNIYRRLQIHVSKLKSGKHSNKHLLSAYTKYGDINFTLSVIEECSEKMLLEREQFYIDNNNWETLYNKSKITNSGGGDTTAKVLYLLNLDGTIFKEFKSGAAICKFLNHHMLDYTSINTSAIKSKKYRVVSPEFYTSNIEEIKSWRNFSCKSKYISQCHAFKYYLLYNSFHEYKCKTLKEVGDLLSISPQAVSVILKRNVKLHKRSGYFVKLVES